MKELCDRLFKTLVKKRGMYGDSVGKVHQILTILYPNWIPASAYKDALLIVRVLDKLCRLANNNHKDTECPWEDIAGYAVLGWENHGKRDVESKNNVPGAPAR